MKSKRNFCMPSDHTGYKRSRQNKFCVVGGNIILHNWYSGRMSHYTFLYKCYTTYAFNAVTYVFSYCRWFTCVYVHLWNCSIMCLISGRYLFLNAIANQLRYPNSHTHYFSCTLLYLFAEANTEAIQEQITR